MDGSLPSSDVFARELVSDADEVSRKLRGGVWEHSDVARSVYLAVLGFGRWLSVHGVTPNALTYVALVLALASGVTAALAQYLLAALLLLLSGALDLLDGVVARAGGTSSRFGALLDSTADRLADALPLVGLVVTCSQPLESLVLMVAMLSGFAVSYVRARAEGLGVSLPPLFMRRAERLVLLLLALLAGSITLHGFPARAAMVSIIALMALLSLVAAIWAMRAAYVALARNERPRVSVPAVPTPSRP
jgi:CDP-diacylglycerol--glycerol-3-phosphate 3-phosphatidyltransferase